MTNASPEELENYIAFLLRMSEGFRNAATILLGLGVVPEGAMAESQATVCEKNASRIRAGEVDSELSTSAGILRSKEEIYNELERLEKKAREAQAKAGKEWRKKTR